MSNWAGNLVRLARLERGLSQRDLARKAATSQAAVAAYESGRRSPSLQTLARIVRSAGLDLRIRLEPLDDHDEWVLRYEANLPSDAVQTWRRRDRALLTEAAKERKTASREAGARRERRVGARP
ncbi:MAG: helix-turn-helix transcriptional regulator [Acidobacteria bacterium]|nr:helix-turn-helix transcriptional regulator [Acidobacteriota bacterium]